METETCTEKVKRVTADGDREPFIEKLKCIIERADGIDIFYSEPPRHGGEDIQCFVMFQGLEPRGTRAQMVTIASVDVWRRFTDEENSESQLGAAVRKVDRLLNCEGISRGTARLPDLDQWQGVRIEYYGL